MNVKVYDLTNDPEFIIGNKEIVLSSEFNFMEKAKTKVWLKFPMGRRDAFFYFGGNLGNMDLSGLNPILVPNAGIEIASGTNNYMQFDGMGNADSAWGVFHFRYNDLSLKVLKKNKAYDGQESKFMSFIANKLMHNSNPSGNRPERVANMYFERDPNKGIINLMVKAIINGAFAVIGPENKNIIKDDPPKNVKNDEGKTRREERKEARKEKRDDKKK
jgi:hypothetical protein